MIQNSRFLRYLYVEKSKGPMAILSVGDANFQEKSRKRMMELMSGGTTVLFVSHNLEQIREMCSKVVWLEHGTVQMVGDTKEVCDAYAKA